MLLASYKPHVGTSGSSENGLGEARSSEIAMFGGLSPKRIFFTYHRPYHRDPL